MRILFAGGSGISVPSLRKAEQDHEIVYVLTHPDKAAGRGKKIKANPVKEAALELGLPLLETDTLDDSVFERIRSSRPELLVAVSYGRIFSQAFLSLFPLGGVNVHPSLLPRYRGPSPITAAILHGDSETGITVQRLALKMDSGGILAQEVYALNGTETTGSLTEALAEPAAGLLGRVLNDLEDGTADTVPQNETLATYCRMIQKEDGRIDWNESAEHIERMVRAYSPWPRAFTFFQGKFLYILEGSVYKGTADGRNGPPGKVMGIDKKEGILIKTGNGMLNVRRLQLQAKKPLDWKSFMNGIHDFTGACLGA